MEIVRDPLVDALQGLEVFRVAGPGEKTIRCALAPAARPRGGMVFAPGRTEYIEKHAETVAHLVGRGFTVLIIDHRGQGLSDRLTANPMAGHLDSFGAAAEHLAAAVTAAGDRLPKPLGLLTHSMGGAIGLEALLLGLLPDVVAAAHSGPMWDLPIPPHLRALVRLLSASGQDEQIAPTVPKRWAPEAFDGNALTHDPRRFARNNALMLAEPRLQIGGATVGWVRASLDVFAGFSPERLAGLKVPTLVVSGAADTVVDTGSHIRVCGQLPDATCRVVAGAKHEILCERDDLRAEALALFDAFFDAHIP